MDIDNVQTLLQTPYFTSRTQSKLKAHDWKAIILSDEVDDQDFRHEFRMKRSTFEGINTLIESDTIFTPKQRPAVIQLVISKCWHRTILQMMSILAFGRKAIKL
ncbi:hypothetical protein BDA99DRAFT_540990 [Phascolomyces articulosus]|uniref:Uncharacterized protein n=1 Tax=Phascolomyces articulosus TaxID=60185 RepID=A0AAD5K2L3_9FUNG|nr:hypothetical protein BDA99DRAFT_540990 [Phascolomyces articulosus]